MMTSIMSHNAFRFSNFYSRHTVGIAVEDIMYHILVFTLQWLCSVNQYICVKRVLIEISLPHELFNTAYVDYMDFDVCCSRKAFKFINSHTRYLLLLLLSFTTYFKLNNSINDNSPFTEEMAYQGIYNKPLPEPIITKLFNAH